MLIFERDLAGITSSESGVEISADNFQATYKHYNVKVEKIGDMFTITGEEPSWDCFLNDEYDPKIVDTVVEKYVKTTPPFFFGLVPPKRYVRGW